MRFLPENLNRKAGRLAVCVALTGFAAVGGCTNPQVNSFNILDTKSWIDPSELAGRVNKRR